MEEHCRDCLPPPILWSPAPLPPIAPGAIAAPVSSSGPLNHLQPETDSPASHPTVSPSIDNGKANFPRGEQKGVCKRGRHPNPGRARAEWNGARGRYRWRGPSPGKALIKRCKHRWRGCSALFSLVGLLSRVGAKAGRCGGVLRWAVRSGG